ncbi:MAG: hypothetical protein ACTHKT_11225 [Solirubrobacterales bacterium]
MHDKGRAAQTTHAEDEQLERAVFNHLMEAQPTTLRLSDLIREFGDPDDFAKRDAVERAVRDLVNAGLLFRCEGAVLPTRQAIRSYELLVDAG